MESSEARIRTPVRALDRAKRPEDGRVGTIEYTYGPPDDLLADVRFEDGSVRLYWCDELRAMEEPR